MSHQQQRDEKEVKRWGCWLGRRVIDTGGLVDSSNNTNLAAGFCLHGCEMKQQDTLLVYMELSMHGQFMDSSMHGQLSMGLMDSVHSYGQ